MVLLAPDGADATLKDALQTALPDLASQSGLSFEVVPVLSQDQLGAETKLVVALPPDPGISALAAGAPGTQFLAVGIPGLQAGTNMSVINAQGERPDRQGFLAGYLAAVLTPDWRVAVISQGDTLAGKSASLGFSNGVIYYCGLCRPAHPPFVQYPQVFTISASPSAEEIQATVGALTAAGVQTVFVEPGAASPDLILALADAEIVLIGGSRPAGFSGQWAASIHTDLGAIVPEAVTKILQGETGISLEAPLVIDETNGNLLTPGKMRMLEEARADLGAGYLDTGVDLSTGERK